MTLSEISRFIASGGAPVYTKFAANSERPARPCPRRRSGHDDLFGATVQLAFRLCSEAEADGIIVSGLVRDLCSQDAARFVSLGDRQLKGFVERTLFFRFEWRN